MATPTLFILGMLFIFVLGGLTGVMVAVIPFDWQVHDTYFVVAHFHYVLIGGMVFPLFAAFYYWLPFTSRHALSERLGRWVFWLMFTGFHVAFFPMHLTGLLGMPRRVYTYLPGLGWDALNLVSTLGAFLIAAGVALFLFDLARRFRMSAEENAGNVWGAGTLEWLPNGNYSNRSAPIVESRYPLWDDPKLAERVEAGAYYLPGSATGTRDTIVTSPVDAQPQFVLRLPLPGWAPLVAAWFTAAFFILLTFKLVLPALACGALAVAALLHWGWQLDPPANLGHVGIGGGISLPTYVSGPVSQAWWAMMLLALVAASLYSCLLFSYLYLWLVSPQLWPAEPPPILWPAAAAVALALSSALVAWADRRLAKGNGIGLLWPAMALLVVAFSANLASRETPAAENAYGAIVHAFLVVDGFFAGVAILLALFALARRRAGRLDAVRRVTFDNAKLFWHYTVAQTLAGVVMVHGFARVAT
jgi:cytochrome c oxidase subunit I+III